MCKFRRKSITPPGLKIAIVVLAFMFIGVTFANAKEIAFPSLSGRVVDNAGLLSTDVEKKLTRMLKAHEDKTSNQFVVVTLKSLQGQTIEDFGYQLGRHWGIGQKKTNNGVLLIIAPNERKVRIEVGYGLEGTLTDAISTSIIDTIILPKFKAKNMSGGIVAGVKTLLPVLEGAGYKPLDKKSSISKNNLALFLVGWLVIIAFCINILSRRYQDSIHQHHRSLQRDRFGILGGSGGGGLGGGGFGGGGGGFGGGGGSGGW